MEEKVWDLH